VDGLISVSQELDDTTSRRLRENRLESVIIEFNDPYFSTIEINDVVGGKLATRYLIDKGYRRIAFIGGRSTPIFGINPIIRRLAGYREAMREAKLEVDESLVHEYDMEPGSILRGLSRDQLPLAIFAATDLQAIAILREARVLGLRVPQDVAVVGFDDIDMAAFFGLTTIHQPLDESGRIAAKILVSRLENPSQTIQHIELPLQVIERESV
jgi:LacI family transcriptional regulator